MRLPKTPPPFEKLLASHVGSDPKALLRLLHASHGPLVGERYRHWHRLQFLEPPTGLSREEWWLTLKLARNGLGRRLSLLDREGKPFTVALVDPAHEMLHQIDGMAGKAISAPGEVFDEGTRERHLVTSLMEEAITSSQLEGAATTRDVAKDMLRSGRAPRTHAERMIHNNYATITWLRDRISEPLSVGLVGDIHARMTAGTLDDPADEGRFRLTDDIRVHYLDEIVHQPPNAADLRRRMDILCAYANGELPGGFVHPVVRAIVLHFWLAYEHPFVDGNGRTARAIFYWSMLRSGHWIAEFLPISRIFLQSPARYARAFLYSESDENDLTYFLLFHLDVLRQALNDLHAYLRVKSAEQGAVRAVVSASAGFNQRQIALLSHALDHRSAEYTIASHAATHGVVYQTARTDLMKLEARKLFERVRVGNLFVYRAADDLSDRMRAVGSRRKRRRDGRDSSGRSA